MSTAGASTAGSTVIETGGQATVFRQDHAVYGSIAVKVIPKSKSAAAACEKRTAKRLANQHPHITRTLAITHTPSGDMQFLLELAHCDMHDALSFAKSTGFGESAFCREWMLQIAHGLAHAHAMGIAHRDLKPENLLMFVAQADEVPGGSPARKSEKASSRRGASLKRALTAWRSATGGVTDRGIADRYVAKLCDFGSAFIAPSDQVGTACTGHAACGSTKYSPPEVRRLMCLKMQPADAAAAWPEAHWEGYRSTGYNVFAADVWAFAVIMYVAAMGSRPWRYAHVFDQRFRGFVRSQQRYASGDSVCAPRCGLWASDTASGGAPWSWPSHMSPALRDLLQRCLRIRPEERCTMADVLEHPWFTNPAWVPEGALHSPFADHVAAQPKSAAASPMAAPWSVVSTQQAMAPTPLTLPALVKEDAGSVTSGSTRREGGGPAVPRHTSGGASPAHRSRRRGSGTPSVLSGSGATSVLSGGSVMSRSVNGSSLFGLGSPSAYGGGSQVSSGSSGGMEAASAAGMGEEFPSSVVSGTSALTSTSTTMPARTTSSSTGFTGRLGDDPFAVGHGVRSPIAMLGHRRMGAGGGSSGSNPMTPRTAAPGQQGEQ